MIPELRAGWADALRTRKPRPRDLRVGGLDYKTGFVAGAIIRRIVRHSLRGES